MQVNASPATLRYPTESNWDAINMTFTVMSDVSALKRPKSAASHGNFMAALILVVDDDPIQRRLLEAMTRRFGYEVETAETGEAGLARLEASDRPPVDLVVLDLVMPDLDGMGVLSRMRQRGIAIPAIVQTAHGSIEAVISAMRAGAL